MSYIENIKFKTRQQLLDIVYEITKYEYRNAAIEELKKRKKWLVEILTVLDEYIDSDISFNGKMLSMSTVAMPVVMLPNSQFNENANRLYRTIINSFFNYLDKSNTHADSIDGELEKLEELVKENVFKLNEEKSYETKDLLLHLTWMKQDIQFPLFLLYTNKGIELLKARFKVMNIDA